MNLCYVSGARLKLHITNIVPKESTVYASVT
jgi:hypothetical protein